MLNGTLTETLREKAKKIKLLLLDVDGVLTDGRIVYDSRGRDMKFFDVHDGLGVYILKKAGIKTVLVTAKRSKAILPRARDMRVEEVFSDIKPKSLVLDKILKKYQVDISEICFVGDDLVDLCLMKRVGFAVAVFNAAPEIKQAASYITVRHGGRGAVREVAELILKSQGKWEEVLRLYDS
jgi:3-deoxy-D-manno-octulosonate 8-phosphate phosphatase (KDO 8-P phosphatase)